jgi:hypothetical protein
MCIFGFELLWNAVDTNLRLPKHQKLIHVKKAAAFLSGRFLKWGFRGSKSNHTKNAAVSPPIEVKIVLIAAV